MADHAVEVRFGGEQVEFLSILVRGRAYRQSRDYWDGNWLLVTVTIQAGKFSGQVPGMLRAEELKHFLSQLQALSQARDGLVSFTTTEGWLTLQIAADKLGNILISGTISDDVGALHNELSFALQTEPSVLTAPLKQLQQVVERYPVVGKP